jgi:hypothetical protein
MGKGLRLVGTLPIGKKTSSDRFSTNGRQESSVSGIRPTVVAGPTCGSTASLRTKLLAREQNRRIAGGWIRRLLGTWEAHVQAAAWSPAVDYLCKNLLIEHLTFLGGADGFQRAKREGVTEFLKLLDARET